VIQVIVSGKVEHLTHVEATKDSPAFYNAEVHEKVWNGKKEDIRIWDIRMDAYTGERLSKAMVQIKYFGFICDRMGFSYEMQGKDNRLVVWLVANARQYFTL